MKSIVDSLVDVESDAFVFYRSELDNKIDFVVRLVIIYCRQLYNRMM